MRFHSALLQLNFGDASTRILPSDHHTLLAHATFTSSPSAESPNRHTFANREALKFCAQAKHGTVACLSYHINSVL